MRIYTQREIVLTVYAHEWYWLQVVEMLNAGKLDSARGYCMPLLHTFYSKYCGEMPSFPIFSFWLEAIQYLGRPVERKWSGGIERRKWANPYFPAWKVRTESVLRFLQQKATEKNVKARRRWSLPYGGKWRKEWEPCREIWQEKKEAREKKKKWRDKLQKGRDAHRRYPRGPGRCYKKLRSSVHRSWVKQNIHNERWDCFWPKEREIFYDWYVWS